MIVSEKSIESNRDAKGGIAEGVKHFISFHPNWYKLPVNPEVFDKVVVGKSYEIDLVLSEAGL